MAWIKMKNIEVITDSSSENLPDPQSFQWIAKPARVIRNITDQGVIKQKITGFYPILVLRYIEETFKGETQFADYLNTAKDNLVTVIPNEDHPDIVIKARMKSPWRPDYWRDYIWGKHYEFELVFEGLEVWNILPGIFPILYDYVFQEDYTTERSTISAPYESLITIPFVVNNAGIIWLHVEMKNMILQFRAISTGETPTDWVELRNAGGTYAERYNYLGSLSAWDTGDCGKIEIQVKAEQNVGFVKNIRLLSAEEA